MLGSGVHTLITQTQSCPYEPHSPGGEADPLCIYPSEPGTHLCMSIKIEKTCFLKWFTSYMQGASCVAVPPVFQLMELFPRGDTSRTTRRTRRLALHFRGSVSRHHSPLCLPQDSQRYKCSFERRKQLSIENVRTRKRKIKIELPSLL